jgi:hypothetical protein
MDFSTLNHAAVIVASLATFFLGALWYSPVLFGKAWAKENKFTDEEIKSVSKARMLGWSLLFSVIMAYNLALFLNDTNTDLAWGATAGFLVGFGWVFMSIGIIGVFENRSWKYIWINGGYKITAFTIMGLIIGGWR